MTSHDDTDFGRNWAADRALTHGTETAAPPKPRLKIRGAWGQATGRSDDREFGWVRCRDLNGCVWVLRGSCDLFAMQEQGRQLFDVSNIQKFAEKITRHGSIDADLWMQETGPEAQETTPEQEYADANGYH